MRTEDQQLHAQRLGAAEVPEDPRPMPGQYL